MENVNNCWHVCTEGLKDRLMFRDAEDFIAGMNSVAMCLHGVKVAMLAFCLMNNHVHFVVNGEKETVKAFINRYVKRIGMLTEGRYGEKSPFHGIGVLTKPILSRTQLATVISYVHRNPLAAGLCTPPTYEWSSASVFFSQRRVRKGWRKIGDIAPRKLRDVLKTRAVNLPRGWLLNEEDMIMPQSYLRIGYVERLYGSPVNYMFSLNTNKDAEIEAAMLAGRRAFSDEVMRRKLPAICKEHFGIDNFDRLRINDKYALVTIMHRLYACNVKQIVRLTAIDSAIVSRLLGKGS